MFPVAPPPLLLPSPLAPWASGCYHDSPVKGQRSRCMIQRYIHTSCTFNRSLRSPISIFSLRWALLRAARQRDSRSLSVVHTHTWLVSHDYHMILQSMPGSCRTAGTICLGDVNRWYIVFVGSVNTCYSGIKWCQKWYLWCQVVSVLTNSS